jgi:DNA-binding transcriptional ArsR family regulator
MKDEILQIQASAFNTLAHPMRLKILEKLRAGPCCVCKIIPYVGGEQSNVSHHLAILRKAELVQSEKHGLEVWYQVTDTRVFKVIDQMAGCIVQRLKKNQTLLRSLQETTV